MILQWILLVYVLAASCVQIHPHFDQLMAGPTPFSNQQKGRKLRWRDQLFGWRTYKLVDAFVLIYPQLDQWAVGTTPSWNEHRQDPMIESMATQVKYLTNGIFLCSDLDTLGSMRGGSCLLLESTQRQVPILTSLHRVLTKTSPICAVAHKTNGFVLWKLSHSQQNKLEA